VTYNPPDAGVCDQVRQSCEGFVRLGFGQCDDKLQVDLEAKAKYSCFTSRVMHSLYANFAPCLRLGLLCHGKWVEQARTVPFDPAVVNVVWQIQIGDIVLCDTSSPFYRNVIGYMAPFLHDSKSVHFLVGGPGWEAVNSNCVAHFHHFISDSGMSASCLVKPLFLTVRDSLVHMMTAGILVSTSSSFPDIASMFSGFPVIISPPPKHGFSSNLVKYLPDVANVDGWTRESKPNHITNTMRPSNTKAAEAVLHDLFDKLATRFPGKLRAQEFIHSTGALATLPG
jgi:hypothetical protein